MITKEKTAKYNKLLKEADKYELEVYNYVFKILKCIYSCFDKKPPNNFWFWGADEGERGKPSVNEEIIYYEIEMRRSFDGTLYDGKYDYEEGIPTRFLYMKLNEIEREIKERLVKLELTNKAKKEKDQKRLTKKEKALAKLTEEEKKLLGVK